MPIIKCVANPSKNRQGLKNVLNYITRAKGKSEDVYKTSTVGFHSKDTNSIYRDFMINKNTFKQEKGRMYFHIVQSFDHDTVTADEAHKIGVELAEKVFNQKDFKVVVSTHQDKKHIHNHLIIDNVNFETGKKLKILSELDLKGKKKIQHEHIKLQDIKDISDEISLSYGVPIIKGNENKSINNQKRYEAIYSENGYIRDIADKINDCLRYCSDSYEDYFKRNGINYTIDREKNDIYFNVENKTIKLTTITKYFNYEKKAKMSENKKYKNLKFVGDKILGVIDLQKFEEIIENKKLKNKICEFFDENEEIEQEILGGLLRKFETIQDKEERFEKVDKEEEEKVVEKKVDEDEEEKERALEEEQRLRELKRQQELEKQKEEERRRKEEREQQEKREQEEKQRQEQSVEYQRKLIEQAINAYVEKERKIKSWEENIGNTGERLIKQLEDIERYYIYGNKKNTDLNENNIEEKYDKIVEEFKKITSDFNKGKDRLNIVIDEIISLIEKAYKFYSENDEVEYIKQFEYIEKYDKKDLFENYLYSENKNLETIHDVGKELYSYNKEINSKYNFFKEIENSIYEIEERLEKSNFFEYLENKNRYNDIEDEEEKEKDYDEEKEKEDEYEYWR